MYVPEIICKPIWSLFEICQMPLNIYRPISLPHVLRTCTHTKLWIHSLLTYLQICTIMDWLCWCLLLEFGMSSQLTITFLFLSQLSCRVSYSIWLAIIGVEAVYKFLFPWIFLNQFWDQAFNDVSNMSWKLSIWSIKIVWFIVWFMWLSTLTTTW